MRVSKADGSQSSDLQRDALLSAGVDTANLYEDRASGRSDARPGLDAALKALRGGDVLVVWKLDRLGRNLRHLVNTVHDLTQRKIGFKVLTGQGAAIDTTEAAGKLVFGIFAALAEFERELMSERTKAGLASARARGRKGGAPFKMTTAKLDGPDEPKQFAADGNHGLMLGFSTNQEMPKALVEPLLCIPGDGAGCCRNLALTFAQVTAHAGSMPVVPSRLDDNPAQMRVSGFGDTPATNVATAAVFGRNHAGVSH